MTRQQIASQQASRQPTQLKQQLQESSIVVAPGVFDALGASLAEQAGFDTVYLSGASLAYTQLGRPDIGLLSITEICTAMSHIRERTNLSVVVDCDTGFGNAMNVMRSVRLLERSGANAIQLEDQTYPKRCGHLRGKTLVSKSEMVGKLHAALDARESDNTLITAAPMPLAWKAPTAPLSAPKPIMKLAWICCLSKAFVATKISAKS